MNQEEIKKILPHRDNMLLVEEAESVDENTAKGRYTIKGDEFFLQGHFPGNPVCPGVFHIGMLKDCVRTLTGRKVFVSSIRQCRLTSVATPAACPELKLTVSLQPADGGYDVAASLEDEERTYMEYRGRMSVEL